MDSYHVLIGIGLGVLGGVLSILDFSLIFVEVTSGSVGVILEYLVVWYVVGAGLGFLVISGALLAYRGYKVGRYLVLIPSLSFPVSFLFLPLTIPGNTVPILHYYPFIGSHWLVLSLIGGAMLMIGKVHAREYKCLSA